MQEKRPDFFVVGAPKAATSSLYEYMHQHADVFVPPTKEPHYFSYPEVADTYYQVRFVTTEEEYLELFAGRTTEAVAGDFSPSYLFYPQAAQRIRAFRPEAKIVILLRNPIKRAISHYLMDLRQGYQRRPLVDFLEPTEENRLFYREYVEVGMYSTQVDSYLKEFGPDRVLILLHEELVQDPNQFMMRIFRFLGVAEIDIDSTIAHNRYEMPRFDFIRTFMRSRFGGMTRLIPPPVRRTLKRVIYTRAKPDLGHEEWRLAQIYREDIEKLSRILDRDISAWLPSST